MQYVQDIILDINSNVAYTTIGAKQGDGNSRSVNAYLTKNGETYTIPDGATAYFRFRKPDGNAIINTATISEDRHSVQITLTAQTLIAAGRGYADIVLQQGPEILSTVSFIIIIMASPAVANQANSSDEFGYLNAVVADSLDTIYEAEAWAAGTRGGIAVSSADYFNITHGTAKPSHTDVIQSVDVTQSSFYNMLGHEPGLSREYTFTYKTNDRWGLAGVIHNGSVITEENEKIVTDTDLRNAYGIIAQCSGGVEPNEDNFIKVSLAEVDPAYQNNAAYYMAIASASATYIQTLPLVKYEEQSLSSSEQAIARANIGAQVSGDYIANPSEKYIGQYLTYGSDGWAASTLADYIVNPEDKSEGQYLTYGSDGWAASTLPDYIVSPPALMNQVLAFDGIAWAAASISAANVNAIPSILTSEFYGTTLPTNPQTGQIFFVYSGDA